MKKVFWLFFGVVSFLVLTSKGVESAQTDVDATTGIVEITSEGGVDFAEIGKKLSLIEMALKNQYTTTEDNKESSAYIASVETSLQNAKKLMEREELFIQKRIDALGEGPKEGDEELEIITQKRKEFAQEMALQKAKMAEADILLAKIYELSILLVNAHNRILFGNLMTKHPSLLIPQNFYVSSQEFSLFLFNIAKSLSKWASGIGKNFNLSIFISLIISIVILVSALLSRRFILKNFGYNKDVKNPKYEQKLRKAAFVAIARGLTPSLIIGGLWLWALQGLENGTFFKIVTINFLYYLLYVILGLAVSRVIFAPYYPDWRLAEVSDVRAKKFVFAFRWSIVLICSCLCIEQIANQANYPIELLYLLSTMSTGAKALGLILISNAALWIEEDNIDDDNSADDDNLSVRWKTKVFINVFAFAMFLLSLIGYFRLAEFVLNRLFYSGILIYMFVIIKNLSYDLLTHLTSFILSRSRKKFRAKILANVDLLQTVIISPVLLFLLIFSLLTTWGVPAEFLLQAIRKLLFGFNIGNLRVSLISILLGISSFFLIMYAFRIITTRLRQNILTKLNIDEGIRNSLLTTLHFFGTIIAALIGVVIMGVDLTNLALIAGALSIGIGFGLQNIINNLVSGLIILFERPFNVGDWVIINGEEGRIKQVNIRSTIVETFKKSNVIIPNANLLSSSVVNLTHDNNSARYSIKIGVAYGSDIEKVKAVLLECANSNKNVLKNPEPYVIFQDFGSSSLDFELRFYVNNIWAEWRTPSDIRFEINRRFNEEGIEIPFQQIVIHQPKEE